MALSYDDWKKQWEGMDYQTQQRTANMMKDNSTFREYGQRYVNESQAQKQIKNMQPQTSQEYLQQKQNEGRENAQGIINAWNEKTSQNGNNSNGTNGQDILGKDTTAKLNNNIQDQPQQVVQQETPYEGNDQNGEELDTSKFGQSTGQINVKEGTAAQTGQPDYMLNSEARQKEIVNNLNTYWQTNREFFKDRNTFNTMFHYDERDDSQKQLLDSYWKKKTDTDVAMKYTNADSIASGMNNYEITPDQLSLIQDANPDEYKQRQAKVQEQTDLRIANLATPNDPTQTADLFNTLLQKLNLEPGDPYKIYDNWYDMAERLGVFSDSARLSNYQNQLDANHSKMENIMSRYASSAGGTQSDALVAARLSKALAPYQQIETDLQNSYTALLNGRNSNLAVANQSMVALQAQAQEDQRIFNQRLAGLGFAMSTASYRSPEQQAQLQLQTASIQNDMNLLNQSKLNDLSLYNQRQLNAINLEFQAQQARQQNLLNNELTDLSVSDPQQLRANLNNVLSQYYAQWGDIIKRPQQQAVDDIIAYAKEKGISVAQALKENFIEPLQSKSEYKNAIASKYPNPYTSQSVSINKDGSISVGATTYGGVKYTPVNNYKMEGGVADYLNKVGEVGGWCGKFVNDYLQSIGVGRLYGDSISSKTNTINTDKNDLDNLSVGSIAVFDYSKAQGVGENAKNYGHVAIVSEIDKERGLVKLLESNREGDKKVTNGRWISINSNSLKGFFDPSKGLSSTQSNLSTVDQSKKENYIEEAKRGMLTDTQIGKIGDIAAEQGWSSEWQEALKQGKKGTLTDAQIKLMDKTDAQFSSNSIVKEFEDAVNQIQQLQVALNDASGVGDMSAIFTFMKTLDPSSVVRESEFNSAAATAGVVNPKAIWQSLERSYDGKFLTPQQREDFKAIAKEFIKIKANNYQTKYNDLLKRYDYYGLDTNLAPTNMAELVISQLDLDSNSTYSANGQTNQSVSTNWYQSLTGGKSNNYSSSFVNIGGTQYSSNFYDN